MGQTVITKDTENLTLTLERVFEAPRERVWDAWTTEEINNWFGPHGWTTTSKERNITEGGVWHYCMKCTDESQKDWFGQESWGMAKFTEVDRPRKLSYQDVFADSEGNVQAEMPVSLVEMELFDEDGKTRIVSTTTFESPEAFKTVIDMGVEEGIAETWDRLAQSVENEQAGV